MTLDINRDGRMLPRVQLWTWRSDSRLRFVLALWVLGWSLAVTR